MTIIIPIIILLLVMLILSLLQFSPGLFALFYHYALGKNTRTKTDNLSLDYILGAESFTAIIWFSLYAIFFTIFYHNPSLSCKILPWIIAGIILVESIIIFLFYYRKGPSTALFISRRTARTLTAESKKISTRKDAFLLGFISEVPELIFTLPIYILIVYILAYSTFIPTAITIIFFIIISTIQFFIIRTAYRTSHNLATIQHFRIKAKPFIRVILSVCFLLLSLTTIYLGVSYNG